jgi:arylsulfatase A-like enzyme
MAGKAMDRRAFLKLSAAGSVATLSGCGRLQAPSSRAATTNGDASTIDTRRDAKSASADAFDGAASAPKPNVVLVFDDQLRADVCGVYGGNHISTPNIDRLAAGGVVFTNSISSCPQCSPFRSMLQTGRYPTHTGILFNFLEASHVQNPHCLADVFGAAAYETGFIGKWHLSSGWRREEGLFAQNDAAVAAYQAKNPETEFVAPGPGRLGYGFWQAFNFHMDFNNYWYYEDQPTKIFSGKYETETQVDQAIAYMEKRRQAGQRFFLTVAPHPPHPYFDLGYVPAGYLDRIPEDIPWPPNVPQDNNPRSLLEVRCYLAMAKKVDDDLGRLLDYLDLSGFADNTIVVFTSDHGEMHGSHGRTNKLVPYAESINIPTIMRWPSHIPAGLRLDALHTPMDHLPTLCGLAGLPIPREVDGRDLSRVVLGKAQDDCDAVLMGNYSSSGDFCQTGGTVYPEWRGVRTQRYSYWRWLSGAEELYDNQADVYQMNNLVDSDAEPALLDHLRSRLSALLAAAHDDFRPGSGYGAWFDSLRNVIATALGPVRA